MNGVNVEGEERDSVSTVVHGVVRVGDTLRVPSARGCCEGRMACGAREDSGGGRVAMGDSTAGLYVHD